MGNANSILSARIAYLLNLKGPCLSVDTASSSSLAAIHLACESLSLGTSTLALAGGVCLLNTSSFFLAAGNAGMLSPGGKCRPFDAGADGFIPGEAVGVLVLKSLAAAQRDGDVIYGVIEGSAMNQDGKTNGITAPSAPSQTALELEVYERFGIRPETIGYVEAHGTGTRLGDPIEIEALTRAFRRHTDRRQFCGIGSVKSNVGHAMSAAGVVSMIKVLLALRHRQLPPCRCISNRRIRRSVSKRPPSSSPRRSDPGKRPASTASAVRPSVHSASAAQTSTWSSGKRPRAALPRPFRRRT